MFNPAGLGQTIAVVDRSGKVVSTVSDRSHFFPLEVLTNFTEQASS